MVRPVIDRLWRTSGGIGRRASPRDVVRRRCLPSVLPGRRIDATTITADSRSRSRWAALATALVITAGLGLAALTAAPRALAENNGLVTSAPAMGWSSWSFLRYGPTAANIEAQAKALVSSGLHADGYDYINLDDFWYDCPGARARTWTPTGAG